MKNNKPKKNIKLRLFCEVCAFILIVFALLYHTDKRIMPSVAETMEVHGVNKSMRAIDAAVQGVIGQSGLTTSDMYIRNIGENGRLSSLSANTILINSLCSQVSEETLSRLEQMETETVYLPLGIVTGLDFLSSKGPEVFAITVRPMGSCVVDYNTSFKSEGINQVNYQIWLDIRTRVVAVNPLLQTSFTVEKKLPIVNTYISGDVPESMLYPFKIE